ncbi:histidine kinase [Streptomyces sp. DSM 41014]|uniref:histidine kinase n=1 Tax=Streptomyces hintoniae TaxID=3075521 RepID=A0ABU2UT44_9ACTN|nr:histidine kinase [Streptomyces sp. DSM 41014]MDT0476452.1 histidine kinase [Streptomyces sp. DSM 41014]
MNALTRVNRDDDRLLPVLLLCAQAAVWPGADLVRGAVPPASALLVAVLVAGTVTAALAVRRTRPVVTLILVAAACALGAGALPAGGTAVLGTAGMALALFTVATERDTYTAVLCVLALAFWQFAQNITLHGLSGLDGLAGLDPVPTTLLYLITCGVGLRTRRTRRARRTAERRLKRAEAERHRLPAAERRRMERELHDVSAHHLTAVVVTAGAALGLRERRPELAAEALEFAVETGRTVSRALGAVRAPAPSREELPSPEKRLRALVAGFRRLDQPVDDEIDPLPEGVVADAAFGIVREALTNVARHAPGAATTVVCRYGDTRTDVVVTSAAPPAGVTAHGAGLGGGRGQGFLRSRAREAGGTLSTGPTPDGGWEVRAELPGRTAAPDDVTLPPSYRVAQVVAAIGLCVQPLLPVLVMRPEPVDEAEAMSTGWEVTPGVLFALLAAAQAVALLWLRRAPRAAPAVLLGLAALWPVAMAAADYAGPVLPPAFLGALALCVAVARTAARETSRAAPPEPARRGPKTDWTRPFRPRPTTPEPGTARRSGPAGRAPGTGAGFLPRADARRAASVLALAAVVVQAAAAAVAVLDRGTTAPTWAVVVGAGAGSAAMVGAARWAGVLRGRRERDARGAGARRLAGWTQEAVRDAWAERRRIAAGLETTVLARTADMVAQAESGHLDATADRARAALAAMRALLDTVRAGDEGPTLRPQPTLQALDLLAHQCRATGRDVEIRLGPGVPEHLPTAVDLAAYHAAETLLAAGGEDPATIEIDADDGTLTLTATGVPEAARPAVRDRLTARVAALGGTLTAGTAAPAGTVSLLLPLTADRAPAAARTDEERDR